MASHTAALLAIAILTLPPTALPTAQPLPPSSSETGCGPRLLLLAPCAPFAQGAASAPPDACCDGLVNVYRDRPRCLCLLLDGSVSLPINHTLALQLPLLCRLALPDGPSICPGLAMPPEIRGRSANSSAAASPATMVSPAPRMNNLLLGLNWGGKLRVEGASIVMAVIIIVLAGAF